MASRRLFVFFLATAFIVAGTVARTFPMVPGPVQDHHGSMAAADVQQEHTGHQGHGGHDTLAAMADGHDHAQPKDAEHDCLKCCTMCGVAGITVAYLGTPMTFAYGPIRFQVGQRHLLGHLVPPEPDIPKSIV